jgi:FKBP-type peptidyl-prolyl cis-trans isomerase
MLVSVTCESHQAKEIKMNQAAKFSLFVLAIALMTSCNRTPKSDLKSDKAKLSYAIGQQIGQSVKADGIEVDVNALAMAIHDVTTDKKSALTPEELQQAMVNARKAAMDKQKAEGEKNLVAGKKYLEENKGKPGIKVTSTGLQYRVVDSGKDKGKSPKDKDVVVVHYTGKLIDGKEFDSSKRRGQPAEFPVGGVIPGWTEALKMMKPGDKWEVFIPAELAYGEAGRPGIPPNSVLNFDIELITVKPAKK